MEENKLILKNDSYLFAVDGKKDFIVYNINHYKLSNETINKGDLVELSIHNKDIQKLKSEAWSSNCKFFFVLQNEGIYLFNFRNNIVWLCKKRSFKFIEIYLDY